MWAGDYQRFRPKIVQIGSTETESQFVKSRNWRAFVGFTGRQSRPIWRRIENARFAKAGWWCAQSYANRSRLDFT